MTTVLFVLFPFAFVGMWFAVNAVMAQAENWPVLHQRFPGGPRPEGQRLRGCVANIGGVSEKNITVLVLTPAGLYLYSILPYRFRRPPVLVPWEMIQYRRTSRFLWMHTYTLALSNVTTMRVTERAWKEIAPHLAMPSATGA